MGCFKACFGSSKRSKIRKPSSATLIQYQNVCHDREINEVLQCVYSTDEFKIKDPIAAVTPAIKENAEEEEKQSNEREKVAYHSDMMKSSQNELNLLVKCHVEEEELKGETNEFNTFVHNINEKEKKSMSSAKRKDDEIEAAADSGGSSSLFTYPPNHRYHNCTTSSDDDESEVTDLDKTILIDVEKDGVFNSNGKDKKNDQEEQESSESLFSLPIDSKKEISASKLEEKEVNSPLTKPLRIEKNRRQSIQSVLNPIENLSQWRSAKEKTALNDQEKENKNMFLEQGKENLYQEFSNEEEPIFKKSKSKSKQAPKGGDDEIGMDTSLSSWLKGGNNENDSPVSVGTCSKKRTNNSSRSFDDRPILGELTFNELKKADDMVIISTVGSYWKSKASQSGDSNSNKPRWTSRNSEECKN